MLDDELELIREEWSMPIHLDGLQVFPGKEWLETALDFPHGAFGLLQESPEIFHAGYGVSDVVPEGNVEPINRVQLYLDNLAAYAHVPNVEPIVVGTVNRDIDYFYSLAGILVFNGDDLLDDGDLVVWASRPVVKTRARKNAS